MCQKTVYTVKVTAVVILESVNPLLCQSGATVVSINKKLKAKRKHSNVLAAKKRNHSANEACENMTKKSRNNTEKSYSTTENGMPEGLKFDAAKKKKPLSQ